jgi:4-amino-4-deoxy-L-arabinose transferase-like glycosyltransferase
VLAVELWPVDARPYIGGSQTNSVLELVLGYNGLGRLTGEEVGSVVPGGTGAGGGSWGPTGLTRLFTGSYAGDASWLLPAALVLIVVLLWWTRREPRTGRTRAAALAWGGWLVVTTLVFSLMAGIFHSYYQVVLAPAIGALAGIGAVELWRRRAGFAARAVLAVVLAGTVVWAFVLLNRAGWQPWLAWTALVLGLIGAVGLLGVHRFGGRARVGVVAVAVVAALAAPAGWSIATAATPHSGAIPSSGPREARMGGMGMGGMGGPGGGRPGGRMVAGAPGGGPMRGGEGLMIGGNILGAPTPPAELTALLQRDAGAYTWAAATIGSNGAAGYQLASGEPVMALGGFNGTDPFPTLAGFQQLVADGRIHYFIGEAGRSNTQSGGSDEAHRIGLWVQENFAPITVGGTTVYDLTQVR